MSTITLSDRIGKDQDVHQHIPPTHPPLRDGGPIAWLQCAGAFCLFFNSWGLVNTFGKYDSEHLMHFKHTLNSINFLISIRRIPSLLRRLYTSRCVTIEHIVDWVFASISVRLWGRHYWSTLRSWVSADTGSLRKRPGCAWTCDDKPLQ